MAESQERSAEEREAARRDRDLRRGEPPAAGDGAAPPGVEPTGVRLGVPQRRAQRTQIGRSRRSRSWPGRVMALAALLLVALILWFLLALFQPFHGSGRGSVTLTIPKGSSTSQIAEVLDRHGVISCAFPSCTLLFELRAKIEGSKLLSGTYHLKRDMSFSSVLAALSTPPPPAKVSEVTIVPGRSRVQIDRLLRSQGVKGSYLADTRHSPLLDPASYGAPRSTPSLEGFLYPDTFQLRAPIRIPALVADQLRDFKRHFATVNTSYAHSHSLSPYGLLIVASLVEDEAGTAHDRPLVASVIYNRLRLGMPLQLDATVRYAVDNYTSPLTTSQLHSPSPWNTYTHKGLPPTPIDSPSLSSIQAAAHPASTTYLYFVVKPCGNGASVFASTYAQFQREEQQYNAARSRMGGRSPEHCR